MKRRIRKKYWNLIFKEVFNYAHMHEGGIAFTSLKIKKHRKILQKLKSYQQIKEGDYRNGYETYGYDSIEEIENNLVYISDRFGVAFRLSWLVKVPEEVDRLMGRL
jgi:signal transduction histidine kinase